MIMYDGFKEAGMMISKVNTTNMTVVVYQDAKSYSEKRFNLFNTAKGIKAGSMPGRKIRGEVIYQWSIQHLFSTRGKCKLLVATCGMFPMTNSATYYDLVAQ